MDECRHENITIEYAHVSCDDCEKEFTFPEFAEMWAETKQANKDLKGLHEEYHKKYDTMKSENLHLMRQICLGASEL
jgi:hypothetical protein